MRSIRDRLAVVACAVVALLMLCSWVIPVCAQEIPHLIKYEGNTKELTKEKKKNKEKEYNITFRIYNIETGGVALWEETHLNVPHKKDEFEVILGSINSLDLSFDEDYWLGIELEDWGESEPRERITSVGYAYMSEDSYKLGGYYPDEFAFTSHDHLGEDIITPVGEAVNADTLDGLHAHEIGGIKDHGALEGLADDDHAQYLTSSRGDARYAGAGWDNTTKLETVQAHIADKDNPHEVSFDQLGTLLWTDADTYIYPNNIGEDLRINDNGTVLISGNGLGDIAALELRGTSDGANLRITNTLANKWGEIFIADPGGPAPDFVVGEAGSMNFRVNSTDWPEMVLNTSGNLGIGTIDPTQRLEVAGLAKANGFIGDGSQLTNINADTVDGLHASALAMANRLYPLNGNAKFPASIIEGKVADSDLLDGLDSTEFARVGHEHDLTHEHALGNLSDVSADEAEAFNAAGEAGASGSNRLATMLDIEEATGGGTHGAGFAQMVQGVQTVAIRHEELYLTMPDMLIAHDFSGGPVKITFDATIGPNFEAGEEITNAGQFAIYIDGARKVFTPTVGRNELVNIHAFPPEYDPIFEMVNLHWMEVLPEGTHTIEVRWKGSLVSYTGGSEGTRLLIVEEL